MTIVLAILALGATAAMRVASNKMEETITSRTVSELSIAAEAAYECYVAGDCATGDPKGWTFDKESEGWKTDYLPQSFLDQYAFSAQLGADENTPKAEIRVDMRIPERAQRVARAFGSSATATDTFVVVTLGIPGTESAIASMAKGIEEGGVLDRVTVGTATITVQLVSALAQAVSLDCPEGLAVRNGVFMCSPPNTSLILGVSSRRSAPGVWTKRHRIGGRLVLENGIIRFKSVYE